jgi:Ser/Thr protein kinase RdoA (MazF antagonist)
MWADIALTDEILHAAGDAFAIDVTADAERLHGGEESATYRVGDNVIRLSPVWREDAELEWCYAVATLASRRVREAVEPRRTDEGRCVIRVAGRPVTVWPFVAGTWAEGNDPQHRRQAAVLLARLHRALASLDVAPRPVESTRVAPTPDLADPDLDATLHELTGHRATPLHGDFYHGNAIVRDGKIVGLVDWDNAFVGPPEQELAWASWEWSDARRSLDLSACMEFVEWYTDAGGPVAKIDEATIAAFVRGRLRWEIAYNRALAERDAEFDPEYLDDITSAYFVLKSLS